MNPELSQLNPNLAQLNPELSQLNPNLSQLNPDLSQLNPNLSQLNPNCKKVDAFFLDLKVNAFLLKFVQIFFAEVLIGHWAACLYYQFVLVHASESPPCVPEPEAYYGSACEFRNTWMQQVTQNCHNLTQNCRNLTRNCNPRRSSTRRCLRTAARSTRAT